MITRNRFVQALYDATWGRIFAGRYDNFLRRLEAAGLADYRRRSLMSASGRTLEIATGTGLNLPHYPGSVTELVLTEPYPHMLDVLRKKVREAGSDATVVRATAERLPFPDQSFDTVVASMILCSADDPNIVLDEIARVLKPDGQYLFLEHVRNPDEKIARRQDRVQPAWFLFGNGCHCNRDTVDTLGQSQLVVEDLDRETVPDAWSIVEAIVIGRARRARAGELVPEATST
jgi:ubiquinone/menaquinone biosynthesis C-methylase UbiE